MKRFFARLIVTLAISSLISAAILMLPAKSVLGNLNWVQTPLAALVIVCGLGKLLYDTLFYDRLV